MILVWYHLRLYERGILDYESIGFLFDLGLVPSPSSSQSATVATTPTARSSDNHYDANGAIIPYRKNSNNIIEDDYNVDS